MNKKTDCISYFIFFILFLSFSNLIISAQDSRLIRTVEWNPDTTLIAIGGIIDSQAGIWIYDAQGDLIKTLIFDDNIINLAWHPTENYLAVLFAGSPYAYYSVWDFENDQEIVRFNIENEISDSSIYWLDESKLITIAPYQVAIHDIDTGEILHQFYRPRSNADFIQVTAVNPDKSILYIASGENVISLWDTANATLIREIQLSSFIQSFAVSPDENLLVVNGLDNMVEILDAKTGGILSQYTIPENNPSQGRAMRLIWQGVTIINISFEAITVYDSNTQVIIAVFDDMNGMPGAVDYGIDGKLVYMSNESIIPIIIPMELYDSP